MEHHICCPQCLLCYNTISFTIAICQKPNMPLSCITNPSCRRLATKLSRMLLNILFHWFLAIYRPKKIAMLMLFLILLNNMLVNNLIKDTKGLFRPQGLGSSPKTQVKPCLKDETMVRGVPSTRHGSFKWVLLQSVNVNPNTKAMPYREERMKMKI